MSESNNQVIEPNGDEVDAANATATVRVDNEHSQETTSEPKTESATGDVKETTTREPEAEPTTGEEKENQETTSCEPKVELTNDDDQKTSQQQQQQKPKSETKEEEEEEEETAKHQTDATTICEPIAGDEPIVSATETQEVSSSKNEDNKPMRMRGGGPSRRRPKFQAASRGFQNFGLTYLPYKSNFEPSEAARQRADVFLSTLK